VRIIAGQWRGRPLVAPEGMATRPTAGRVREALFSMLASRLGSFEGLAVADLFAGTGALGLEALSRGADRCLFVEKQPEALKALRLNIERLGAGAAAQVRATALGHAAPPAEPCDLIMIDPPYASGLVEPALERAGQWLARGGWMSIELHGEPFVVPPSLSIDAERRFGKASLILLRG
jgi:16S rRNA (guanine966-N2)-methyltransferase